MLPDLSRYVRQVRFAPLGEAGQHRLARATVLICGCGALGSFVANLLVRAGVGRVRILDRDFVELSNLQRQVLFDETDAAAGLPKAVAAAEKLARANSQVCVEPIVADLDPSNIHRHASGADLLVDGTDNFETRLLVNDYALHERVPWIYGGCLGSEGQSMTIVPGRTPCLRCVIADCPPPGSMPTCDTAGILGPAVGLIASIEAAEAMKVLSGNLEAISPWLTVVDLWSGRVRQLRAASLGQEANCPTCRGEQFPWLDGKAGSRSAVLCGRNAVQVTPPPGTTISLDELAGRLTDVVPLAHNAYLLRFKAEVLEVTVFADGRAIITGTSDPAVARAVYARYVGA